MLNLSAASKDKLEQALARAEKEQLTLSDPLPLSGIYVVSSSQGGSYQVTIIKRNGIVEGTCECQGHKRGLICKHLALAAHELRVDLTEKAAEKAALSVAALCDGCETDSPVVAKGLCQDCLNTFEELRATEQTKFNEAFQDLFGHL